MVNHRRHWELRPIEEEENDDLLYEIYDNHPELFTIKVHYKGTFYEEPLREYKEGKLRIIDQISEDFFNLTDVDVIALGAGYKYKSFVFYYWRVPMTSLDNGLRPLQCDDDVTEFLYHASYFKFMDVYFDGRPMEKIALLFTRVPNTCVIKYLEDEGETDSGEVRMLEEASGDEVDEPGDIEVIDLGFEDEDELEEEEGSEEEEAEVDEAEIFDDEEELDFESTLI